MGWHFQDVSWQRLAKKTHSTKFKHHLFICGVWNFVCAEQLPIASMLHTPKKHFTVLSFLWNFQRSRMSAWRDAWSVRHWAHHGSAKFWEGCETCSTKVLQSSFGVWNWMGFFGHDFSSPGIEVELNKKMEYIVMNNGSVRTRRSTWFARVQFFCERRKLHHASSASILPGHRWRMTKSCFHLSQHHGAAFGEEDAI